MWTVAAARLILQPEINLQAPPNLSPQDYQRLIQAGINDWGGISPVTIDHVNPKPLARDIDPRRANRASRQDLVNRLAIFAGVAVESTAPPHPGPQRRAEPFLPRRPPKDGRSPGD